MGKAGSMNGLLPDVLWWAIIGVHCCTVSDCKERRMPSELVEGCFASSCMCQRRETYLAVIIGEVLASWM